MIEDTMPNGADTSISSFDRWVSDADPYHAPGLPPFSDTSFRFVPVPAPPPSAKHVREADEFVKRWMPDSADYIDDKIAWWDLLWDLYYNRRRLDERNIRRAQVILLSAQGVTLKQVSAGSGLSETNCLKWRKRFLLDGLDGLKDKQRKGRPPTITPWERVQVMRLACERPFNRANAWSMRELARVTGLGSTSVHRILNDATITPHKIDHWCGKSPDPEFEPKQAAIIGLYLSPPDNALVLSIDEKSHIQALDRTQPELPLRPGPRRRLTATYTRHGTTCLLAALSVHEGTIDARCVDSNTHEGFLQFLKVLYRKHPRKHLYIILDNLSTHKHKDVLEWASRRRRLTLHFTPTCASWLNQVEIWFHTFSRDVVKGGVWHSKKELVDQIMFYINRYNRDRADPFTWTYTGKVLAA